MFTKKIRTDRNFKGFKINNVVVIVVVVVVACNDVYLWYLSLVGI